MVLNYKERESKLIAAYENLIRSGSRWRHISSGKLYDVRNVSKFSSDCNLDGCFIVEYYSPGGDSSFDYYFSTPLHRFLAKFEEVGHD